MRQKWDSKSNLGFFVGYGENTKGYRIYFPKKNDVLIKGDVIFINEQKEHKEDLLTQNKNEKPNNTEKGERKEQQIDDKTEVVETEGLEIEQEYDDQRLSEIKETEKERKNEDEEIEQNDDNTNIIEIERVRRQPRWLDDYETIFKYS